LNLYNDNGRSRCYLTDLSLAILSPLQSISFLKNYRVIFYYYC